MLVLVVVPIAMTLLPTPGFVGSAQAGMFIALYKIMEEDAVIAAAYGVISWACNIMIQALVGLFFLLQGHISLPTLLKFQTARETRNL
jgi:hypothetical protein